MLPFIRTYDKHTEGEKLIEGFKNGFSLGFSGERVPMSARNLKSAYEYPQIVRRKFEKEVQL